MQIDLVPIERVVPYARNPRKNQGAVAKVAASLKEFGWRQPIVVDSEMVVIAGHTRLMAAQSLGMAQVPVHVAEGLTPAQVKAYRLADNRVGEEAEWDFDLLKLEIADLDADGFPIEATGFDLEELGKALAAGVGEAGAGGDGLSENYSRKIEAPIYEITGACPKAADLYDREKTKALVAEIDNAGLPAEVAEFLRFAAERHTVFNFRNIAEFYAHADAGTQSLMERSALVIIDFNKAIEEGFVKLTSAVTDQYARDYADA